VHLGESREELEFLRLGTGPWRLILEELGVWTDTWQAPGCWPVEYLDRFGLVNDRLLAVHCVQLSDDELSRLAGAGATVVTCPRSNRWTGAGTPPVERFYGSAVRVAIGTDSLASVEDLNMFAELAAVRSLALGVPASRILRSATLDGAEALGFGGELGSIEPGKRAELIAVRIPPGIADVEEYLLRGIAEGDVQWLDAGWR
jgi:cytosine/adenosine deaminase-related metal-dependent hydrolase